MNPLLIALVQAGLMEQGDADRLERQLDSQLAREYAEQQMLLSFQAGLASQRERLVDAVRASDGLLSVAQQNRLWAGENELLWASVRDTVLDVASERATIAAIGAGGIDTWNLVNDGVIDWAETYYINPDEGAFGSVPNINLTSRTTFQKAFVEWQRGELGISGRDATGELRTGLDALIAALEPHFGATRAELLASTEVTRIFTESIRFAEAENPFVTQWEWATAVDERVCVLCLPRDGMRIAKNADGFGTETDGLIVYPPAHPRCRCQIIALTDAAADLAPVVVRTPFVPTPVAEPVEGVAMPTRTLAPPDAVINRFAGDNYREFTNVGQMKAFEKYYKPWVDELSADEVEALRSYQAQGFGNINQLLRGQATFDDAETQRIQQVVANMDAAMSRTSVPHNLVTYRGANLRADLAAGDTFADSGYASTTFDKNFAERLARSHTDGVVFQVRAKRGDPGVYIDALNSKDEFELLIPRDTTFRVLEVEQADSFRRITVEIVDNE